MFKKKTSFLSLVFLLGFFFLSLPTTAVFGQKKFTVIVDAGHGGKDPGAIGSHSMEKNLNLSVALKLGECIEKNNPDVNLLYTRKTDVYLTVAERPKYANDVHADLFISIHTNSSPSPESCGVETFTLGVAKTAENLEVAMTENAVILLEDNYKQTYQGFDPKSIESYIMFEFMQDRYMEHSIQFASLVQNQLVNNCNRKNRGVRQAGFLVLKNTAMPSILVEIGFISNAEEEKFLNTKAGQDELANAIYCAFSSFKHEFDKKSTAASTSIFKTTQDFTKDTTLIFQKDTTKTVQKDTIKLVQKDSIILKPQPLYKVQIMARKDLLSKNNPIFKGLKEIGYYYENNLYKYTYKESFNYSEIQKYQQEANKYFKDAFIVSFLNGEKVSAK